VAEWIHPESQLLHGNFEEKDRIVEKRDGKNRALILARYDYMLRTELRVRLNFYRRERKRSMETQETRLNLAFLFDFCAQRGPRERNLDLPSSIIGRSASLISSSNFKIDRTITFCSRLLFRALDFRGRAERHMDKDDDKFLATSQTILPGTNGITNCEGSIAPSPITLRSHASFRFIIIYPTALINHLTDVSRL
jgi:hypothetical protein